MQKNLICFDKSTSVRLVRELKKQIGYLESEVSNG
jgi:predicted DNA-binding protein